MKKSHKTIIYALICVFMMGMGLWFGGGEAFADSDVSIQKSIKEKALLQGVHKCYDDKRIEDSLAANDYKSIKSLMAKGAKDTTVPLWSGSQGGVLKGIGDDYNVRDNALTCYELFAGDLGDAKPILEVMGKQEPTPNSVEVPKFLEGMGYSKGDSTVVDPDVKCMTATYTRVKDKGRGTTNAVCKNERTGKWSFKGQKSEDGFHFSKNGLGNICLDSTWVKTEMEEGLRRCIDTGGRELNAGFLMEVIRHTCGKNYKCEQRGLAPDVQFSGDPNTDYNSINDGGNYSNFVIDNYSSAGDQAVSYLSNNSYSNMNSLGLSPVQKRILYQEYVTDYYEVPVLCSDTDIGIDASKKSKTVKWFDVNTGKVSDCYVQKKPTHKIGSPKKANGVDDNGFFLNQSHDYEDLIDALNDMPDPSEEELEELEAVATEEKEDDAELAKKDCRNSGAGRSLGWILCPILELAGDASEAIYDNLVEPFLNIKSEFFISDAPRAEAMPYVAWETFRDIANIVFAILLLFVIFSQLTGIGIDNYGIKKILPKLIVAVILVNMSYLICMICVDLSNIIGNGIQSLFNEFGERLAVRSITIDNAYPAYGDAENNQFYISPADVGNTVVAAGLIFGLATMGGEIWGLFGTSIIVTLIFAAIGVLISLIFLFFLLAVRQAAVVVLVVISPVAVICNALPNVKSLFDKWVKLFRGLLLVYPIVGFMVGGGNYVSKLILASNQSEHSFFLALTAMIMSIVPIFFIPAVLKEAIALIPRAGKMIQGWENKARDLNKKGERMVRDSELYQSLQGGMAANVKVGKARGIMGKLGKMDPGSMSSIQKMRYRRAAQTVRKAEEDDRSTDAYIWNERYAESGSTALKNDWEHAFMSNGDNLDAMTSVLSSRLGPAEAAKQITRTLARTPANDVTQQAVRRMRRVLERDSSLNAELLKKAPDAYQMVMNDGVDEDGRPQDLYYFSRNNNISDINKPGDWMSQNTGSVIRALDNNAQINATTESKVEFAQMLLDANDNPNGKFQGMLSKEVKDALNKILQEQSKTQEQLGEVRQEQFRAQSQPQAQQTNAQRREAIDKLRDHSATRQRWQSMAGGSSDGNSPTHVPSPKIKGFKFNGPLGGSAQQSSNAPQHEPIKPREVTDSGIVLNPKQSDFEEAKKIVFGNNNKK